MEQENNRLGIFGVFGVLFGFIGRLVTLADKSLKPIESAAEELDPLVKQGFEALNLAIEPTMTELRLESKINKARLQVLEAEKDAEVAKILAELQQ